MTDRCFPFPDTEFGSVDTNRGHDYYRERILELSQKCWDYYDNQPKLKGGQSFAKETLYLGSIGPCCYVRYRIATSPSFNGDTPAKFQMLSDALSCVDTILKRERRMRDENAAQQVTLLNGELVGALTMKIVTADKMLRMLLKEDMNTDMDTSTLKAEIQDSINQFFQFAQTYVLSSALATSECEVLHGRSGFLKAIKFIQKELSDSNFGKPLALEILSQVIEEGNDLGGGMFLLWKWKTKVHLGALHGIAGILHTLADFEEDLPRINPNVWSMIETTVVKMDDYCHKKSGNLAPTLKSTLPTAPPKNSDKLVQFCSGSPGHILLLTQMFRKSHKRDTNSPSLQLPENYLMRAQDIAEFVVLPRGLLRKGVGLCHGISGNGFIFLSIYHAVSLSIMDDSEKFLNLAYAYANFALDNLEELEGIPERPYSLYEGLAGLVCLLLSLVETEYGVKSSMFPCFEF